MHNPEDFKPEIAAVNKLIEANDWWTKTEASIKSDTLSKLAGCLLPASIGKLRQEILSSTTLSPEQVEASLDWLTWLDDDFKINDRLIESMNDMGKLAEVISKLVKKDTATKLKKHKDKMQRIADMPVWKVDLWWGNRCYL